MLVLLGGVMQMSAWDKLYLLCGDNNWTSNDNYKFVSIDGDHFYYILDAASLRSNNFIFRIKDTSNDWGAWENEYSLTSTEYAAQKNETGKGFKISSNANAKFAYIYAEYKKYNNNDNDWRWHLTANIIEETTTVAFVDIDNNWKTPVYAYAWLSNNVKLLGAWQGTEMTYSNNVYTCEVPYVSGAQIKFSDKNAANNSSDMALAKNAVYKYDGRVETVNVSAGALGKSTFSSKYPLDFTGITTVRAYRITSASAGVLGLEQVTGSVPAGIGLYIEGNLGASFDVPTCAVTYATTSMLKPGTGSAVAATESEGAITNFILTNKTVTSSSAPLKFYKANGNTVPVGKAYLQIPTANVGSRDFFWFDNEATEIKTIDNGPLTIDANAPMYNLAGQRVSKNYKGVVIQNGKKMLMK